jgi:hypothetical protein
LAGFDFPLDIPSYYAAKVGITDFLATLPKFGKYEWLYFYNPAEIPSEISPHRPFYPSKPGNSKRLYLEQGLNLPFQHLFRLCEIAHQNRHAACPLFWTMGGQQVGKAAIPGWDSLISPALDNPELNLKLWLFSGSLTDLCISGNIVVVETYPAEFYGHLVLSFSSPVCKSKRRYDDRKAFAPQLISWAGKHNLDLDESIRHVVEDGFSNLLDGEDRFDAFIGLYGMINVILGNRPAVEPLPYQISKIEGWMFGQEGP